MTSGEMSTARLRATIVAVTPILLVVAFLWHPYIPGRLPDGGAVADAVIPDTTRWGLSHLASGIAFGTVVLAFLAIRGHLREAGGDRWSALGLPFVVVGSALYIMLPGMEFAPLAAVEAGADAEAVQDALQSWFVPILVSSGITFLLGILCFAVGIARSGVLSRGTTWLVVGALVVMGVSRLVPLVVGQLYLQGVAALVALWPLANELRKPSSRPVPAARRRRPVPAA